jgi:hypothetical protein
MMNTDELREIIWEQLFHSKVSKSIDEVATLTGCEPTDVRAAVNHEWFTVADDRVSIAYSMPSTRESRR